MEKKAKKLTVNDVLKYEIAAELGLMDKIGQGGWKSLTARESGRIGGILAKRRKDYKTEGICIDKMRIEEIELTGELENRGCLE